MMKGVACVHTPAFGFLAYVELKEHNVQQYRVIFVYYTGARYGAHDTDLLFVGSGGGDNSCKRYLNTHELITMFKLKQILKLYADNRRNNNKKIKINETANRE